MSIKTHRPRYLTKRALRWLDSVEREYGFLEAEMEILIATAEALDRCQWARRRLEREGSLLTSSHGNVYPHPAIQILKDSRNAFFQGCKILTISKEDPSNVEEKQKRRNLRGMRSK